MRVLHRVAGALIGLALTANIASAETVASKEGHDWNDAEIGWKGFEDGLAAARDSSQPICLVYYTIWCPHCKNYARVFHDSRVVEKSKSFVMIRIDRDAHRELSKRHSLDGEYIPRTFFLTSAGELDPALTEERARFRYFYDENDPASILAGMDRALAKLK